MTPDALMEKIAKGTPPAILDVRSRAEFEAGHVPGARHLPFWQVGRLWGAVAHLRDRPIVVYCGHGPRAYLAGAALKRRGFTQIDYLRGHMKAWRDRRLPLERP